MGGPVRFRRLQEPLTEGLVLAGVSALVLLPLAEPVLQVAGSDAGMTTLLAPLAELRVWDLFASTLRLAVGVTIVATTVGVLMGVALGKTDVFGRRAALVVHGFPFFLPPFLVALGWYHLFGRRGLAGSAATSEALFSPAGLVGVLGLTFAPLVTALTLIGLDGVDPALEEAARLVARPARVVTRILFPLCWPTIAFAALVVFALSLSEIGVPMFLRTRTYPAAVFTRLGGIHFAPGEALGLTLPLMATAAVLIVLERRIIGRRSYAALGIPRHGARRIALRSYRVPVSVAVWLVALVSSAPVFSLLVAAWPHGFNRAGRWAGSSATTSLATACASATLITARGIVAGSGLVRRKRSSELADLVLMVAFVIPAAALAVGILQTWNRPMLHAVYASSAILVIGLSARYGIVGVRTMGAVVARTPAVYEEAAAAFGATFVQRLTRILVPMHARGIAGTWLLAAAFCLRDLDTIVVFYPPGLETLPVRIFTLEANGPPEVVAALSVYHAGLTAVFLALGAMLLLSRRSS